jgi:hypothetical protein
VLIKAEAKIGSFRHGTLVTRRAGTLVRASPTDTDVLTHPGVDIAAPCGAGVYALADGYVEDVIESRHDPDFRALGFMALVRHATAIRGKPTYSLYLHLQEPPLVKKGAPVKGSGPLVGTRLGSVGDTGAADGCHLHFEIRHFGSRYLADPKWRQPWNIYGERDQQTTRRFLDNWEDPLRFLGQDWADFFDNLISPDGSTLISLRKQNPEPWSFPAETWLIDLMTGREARVPHFVFPASIRRKAGTGLDWSWYRDIFFRWSPDTRYLAFSRCSGDHDKPLCLILLYDTVKRGDPTLIAEALALQEQVPFPRVHPVGFAAKSLLLRTPADVYAYDLISKRWALVGRNWWGGAISPDGQSLAFVDPGRHGLPNVWISDPQGANRRQLTGFSSPPRQLEVLGWLPGGQAVVFRQDTETNDPEAWAIRIDGSGLQRIGW